MWITDNSKKVDQVQSQATSEKFYTSLCRSTYYIETNAKEQPKWEDKETDPKLKNKSILPQEELDEMEARNLSDREFRVMIIRILNSMKKRHRNDKRTSQK